jgi:hypothetical protein
LRRPATKAPPAPLQGQPAPALRPAPLPQPSTRFQTAKTTMRSAGGEINAAPPDGRANARVRQRPAAPIRSRRDSSASISGLDGGDGESNRRSGSGRCAAGRPASMRSCTKSRVQTLGGMYEGPPRTREAEQRSERGSFNGTVSRPPMVHGALSFDRAPAGSTARSPNGKIESSERVRNTLRGL